MRFLAVVDQSVVNDLSEPDLQALEDGFAG
jgi:hypothetical protein